jgi:hypothetical protein
MPEKKKDPEPPADPIREFLEQHQDVHGASNDLLMQALVMALGDIRHSLAKIAHMPPRPQALPPMIPGTSASNPVFIQPATSSATTTSATYYNPGFGATAELGIEVIEAGKPRHVERLFLAPNQSHQFAVGPDLTVRVRRAS